MLLLFCFLCGWMYTSICFLFAVIRLSVVPYFLCIVLFVSVSVCVRPAPPPEHAVLLKSSLEAFHRTQPGRCCCSRSCYLPLNGVRKPFCLLAGKQRDAETSSLFTASLCGCCCLCSAVSVVFAAVPCIQM